MPFDGMTSEKWAESHVLDNILKEIRDVRYLVKTYSNLALEQDHRPRTPGRPGRRDSGTTTEWLPPVTIEESYADWEYRIRRKNDDWSGQTTYICPSPHVFFKYQLGLRSDGKVVWREVE